jgi:DNA-directed RNA polymerase subunit F
MAKPETISEQPISMVELKQELAKIKERDKELGVISKKTEEYLNQFVSLEPKKLQELKEKLEALKISRLKPEFIIKILDTLPTTVDQLKVLLQGYLVTLNQADMKKVVDVINQVTKPGNK